MCSRTPGLPQAGPAPSRLTLKNTAFPGGITGRWSRVNNFRYYEYQAASPTDPTVGPDWDALPIHSSHAAQATFSQRPPRRPADPSARPPRGKGLKGRLAETARFVGRVVWDTE